MKNKHFPGHIFSSLLILSYLFSCAAALPATGNDEWKDILAIGDEKDLTIGAELTLAIEPDRYYARPGDEIILSGLMKGIFGPFAGSDIIITRNNCTGESVYLLCTTDDTGVYYTHDLLTDYGTYTYQAIYDYDNEESRKPLKSQKLEILCSQLKVPETGAISQDQPSINETEPVSRPEMESNVSVQLIPERSEFYPGESISFTGHVISDGLPASYVPVYIVPGGNGDIFPAEPVQLQTRTDGIVNISYHLPGPDPLSFSMYYQERYDGIRHQSEPKMLLPLEPGINPPVRTAYSSETIDAYIDDETVEPAQNITIYGWYCGKNETQKPFSSLELSWYNFGEKIWDQYQNSSKILTNANGLFECKVEAPQTEGMYLLSVKRAGNSTRPALFSNILPLSVISVNDAEVDDIDIQAVQAVHPGQLLISTGTVPAEVPGKIDLFVTKAGLDDAEPGKLFLSLYYSTDNIDWYLFQEKEMTSPFTEMSSQFIPREPGYYYFRASLRDETGPVVSSQVIVVPVIYYALPDDQE